MDDHPHFELSFGHVFNQFFKAIPKLCAISLFACAIARLDLLGIVFLSLFGVLNLFTPRNGSTKTAYAIWIVTCVYTALYLAAQTCLQIIQKFSWRGFQVDETVLRYFGFQEAQSDASWSRIFVAPGIVLMASIIQLTAIRKYRQGKKSWGICLELDDARSGFYKYLSFLMTGAVCCLYPGLSNLPYHLIVLYLFVGWARGRSPISIMSRRTFAWCLKLTQVYAGAQGMLIYVYQLRAVHSNVDAAALKALPMLGIYRFRPPHGYSERVVVGSAAAHTLALTALFAVLGLACEFPARRKGPVPPARQQSESRKDRADPVFEARQKRTLESLQGPTPRPLANQKSNLSSLSLFFGLGPGAADAKIRGMLLTALQLAGDISWEKVAEQYIRLWEWASSRPSFVGFFLALMATVCPSWPALGVLALGLVLLVVPERWTQGFLRRAAPTLLAVTTLWSIAAQILTSIAQGPGSVHISDNARSLGLYVFPLYNIPYLVPFGSMLLASAALAAHCRRRLPGHLSSTTTTVATSKGRVALPRDSPPDFHHPTSMAPTPTMNHRGTFSSGPFDSQSNVDRDSRANAYRTAALVAKQGAAHVILVALHYLLRLLFPAVSFLVGVSRNDLLHVVYVAAVLFGVARNILLFRSFKRTKLDLSVVLGYSSDIVKFYALIHALLLYVFGLRVLKGYGWGYLGDGWPEGTGRAVDPSSPAKKGRAEKVLELLGLWTPEFQAEILPVLCLLAFACWYSALDSVLKSRRKNFSELMKQLLSDPETSSSLRPVLEHVQGRARALRRFGLTAAILTNTYLLLLLLYVVVVHGVKPGTVLGLGYLALGLAILTLPPTHPGDVSKIKRLRWVFLYLLALYAIGDFVCQYVFTFRVFREEVDLSQGTIDLLTNVIGIDPEVSGRKLVASLVRSGIVLGLLNGHRALSIAHQKRAEKKKSIRDREKEHEQQGLGRIVEGENEGVDRPQSEFAARKSQSRRGAESGNGTGAEPSTSAAGAASGHGLSPVRRPVTAAANSGGRPPSSEAPAGQGPVPLSSSGVKPPVRLPPRLRISGDGTGEISIPGVSASAYSTALPPRTPTPEKRPILERFLADQHPSDEGRDQGATSPSRVVLDFDSIPVATPAPVPHRSFREPPASGSNAEDARPPSPPGSPPAPKTPLPPGGATEAPPERFTPLMGPTPASMTRTLPTPPTLTFASVAGDSPTPDRSHNSSPAMEQTVYINETPTEDYDSNSSSSVSEDDSDATSYYDAQGDAKSHQEAHSRRSSMGRHPISPSEKDRTARPSDDGKDSHATFEDKKAMGYRAMGRSLHTPAVVYSDPPVVQKYGWVAFFQRASILVADPAAILALFFDASRLPSMLHLAIIAVIVVATLLRPFIHSSGIHKGQVQRLLRTADYGRLLYFFPLLFVTLLPLHYPINVHDIISSLAFYDRLQSSFDPRGSFRVNSSRASFDLPGPWRFLISVGLALLYLYGSLTLLLEYLVQLPDLADIVDRNKTVIKWGLGLVRFCYSKHGTCAERALRSKVLLVLTSRLCLHARTWRAELPKEVRKAAPPGRPCPLFFPRPELPWTSIVDLAKKLDKRDQQGDPSGATGSGDTFNFDLPAPTPLARAKAFFGFSATPTAVGNASTYVKSFRDDPPPSSTVGAAPTAKPPTAGNSKDGDSPSAASLSMGAGGPGPLTESEKSYRWTRYIEKASVVVGLKTIFEDPWAVGGSEVTSFVFLLAIYSSLSIVSLILLGSLLVMTLAPARLRALLWRFVVHPILALLLLYQFLAYLGLPEPTAAFNGLDQKVETSHFRHLVNRWLAANPVSYTTLWFLFLAFGCVSIQIVEDRRKIGLGIRLEDSIGDESDSTNYSPYARSSKPILLPRALRDREKVRPVLPRWAVSTLGHLCSDPLNFVFVRLEAQSLPFWTFFDHGRFQLYKHASSAVLVTVFILSLINTSVLHGFYLVWALILFRLRSSMLQRGSRVFKSLAAYNLFVIVAIVLYQIPWRADVRSASLSIKEEKCTALDVVGLYSLRNIAEARFSRLVVPDIVLFLLLRFQLLLSTSETYAAVSDLVSALHDLDVEKRIRKEEQTAAAMVENTWQAWQYNRRREVRVARLNAGIHEAGGAFGVDPSLLDFSEAADAKRPLLIPLRDASSGPDEQVDLDVPAVGFRPAPPPGPLPPYRRMDTAGSAKSARSARYPGRSSAEMLDSSRPGPRGEDGFGSVGVGGGGSMFRSVESHKDDLTDEFLLDLMMQRNQGGFWTSLRTRVARFISSGNYNESHAVLLFICILFITDLSVLSLVFAVGIFAYAFCNSRSSKTFWGALLFYAEALLLANYAISIPYRLGCGQLGSDPSARDVASAIGLHVSPAGVTPLYLVYLCLLMHNYSLVRSQAAREEWKRRQERQLRNLSTMQDHAGDTKRSGRSGSEAAQGGRDLGTLGFGQAIRRATTSVARYLSKTPTPPPGAVDAKKDAEGRGDASQGQELLRRPTFSRDANGDLRPFSEICSVAWKRFQRFRRALFQGAERGPYHVTVTFRCPKDALGPPDSVFALQALDLILNSALREEYRLESVEQEDFEARRRTAPKAGDLVAQPSLSTAAEPTPTGTEPFPPPSFRAAVSPKVLVGAGLQEEGPSDSDPPTQGPQKSGFFGRLFEFLGPDAPTATKFPLMGYGRPLLRTRELRLVDVDAIGASGVRLLGEDPATFGLFEAPGLNTPFATLNPFASLRLSRLGNRSSMGAAGLISHGSVSNLDSPKTLGGPSAPDSARASDSARGANLGKLHLVTEARAPDVVPQPEVMMGPNLGSETLFTALVEVIPLESGRKSTAKSASKEEFAPPLLRPSGSVRMALMQALERFQTAEPTNSKEGATVDLFAGLSVGISAPVPASKAQGTAGVPRFTVDDNLLYVPPPSGALAMSAQKPPTAPRSRRRSSGEFPGFQSTERPTVSASRAVRFREEVEYSPPPSPGSPTPPLSDGDTPPMPYPYPYRAMFTRHNTLSAMPRGSRGVPTGGSSWLPSPSYATQSNPLYSGSAGFRRSGSVGARVVWQALGEGAALSGGPLPPIADASDAGPDPKATISPSPEPGLGLSPALTLTPSRKDGSEGFAFMHMRKGSEGALDALHLASDQRVINGGLRGMQAGQDGASPLIPSWMRVLKIESSCRPELDLYTPCFLCDAFTFLYAAFFFRDVYKSASSLRDSLGENIVPGDYLGCLLFLFIMMLFERAAYALGSQKYKAFLHLFETSFFTGYLVRLFWYEPLQTNAAVHIRIFGIVKLVKMYLSARQLRSGWPSPASYRDGRGRTAPFWMSSVNFGMWFLGFLYMCVPFLWEVRILIDWISSTTTLMLMDYFKLEEINRTLYNTTFNRKVRSKRRMGEKEPVWRKGVHGMLFLTGVVVLLWVPLLAFANSGLSLRDPVAVGANLNATIAIEALSTNGFATESVTLPLYQGGYQLAVTTWGAVSSAVPVGYKKSQMQLLCSSEDTELPSTLILAPTLRAAASRLLAQEQRLRVEFRSTWQIERSIPVSVPMCTGTYATTLSPDTRQLLLSALQGNVSTGPIVLKTEQGKGDDPSRALASVFPLVWRLKGTKSCSTEIGYSGNSGEGARVDRRRTKVELDEYRVFCAVVPSPALADTASPAPLSSALRCAWDRVQPDDTQRDVVPAAVLQRLTDPASAAPTPSGPKQCPAGLSGLQVVTLMDSVHAGLLGETLGSLSISGLYIGFVFAIGRILRGGFTNLRVRIPYDELPCTTKLLQLVRDIYQARAEGNLRLEEGLYFSLINIYRDPQALLVLGAKEKEE